jgi:hypothetical protein
MKFTLLTAVLTVTSVYGSLEFAWGQGKKADQEASVGISPYLFLIRDPAVHRELGLSLERIAEIQRLTDDLDGPLWEVRNKSLEEGTRELDQLIARTKDRMGEILGPREQTRLDQIVLQQQGSRGLLRQEVATQLKLKPEQVDKIQKIIQETQEAATDLQKEAAEGGSVESRFARLQKEQNRKILAAMSISQRKGWLTLLGEPVDQAQFGGGLKYKAPEIRDSDDWINSQPLKIADLRGQVVAVHFFAFG